MKNNVPKRKSSTVSVQLDSKIAFAIDALIRDGLVAASAVSEADNQNLNLSSKKISIELDPKIAMEISKLIRDGLVAAEAVSQADNENITIKSKR